MKPTNLPPEAIELIKQGTPKPLTQSPVLAPVVPVEKPEVKPALPTGESVLEKKLELSRPIKARTEKDAEPSGLVPVNIRLPADISQALLKISSDRKLKKIRPFTQQDIYAEALRQWIQRNSTQDKG